MLLLLLALVNILHWHDAHQVHGARAVGYFAVVIGMVVAGSYFLFTKRA